MMQTNDVRRTDNAGPPSATLEPPRQFPTWEQMQADLREATGVPHGDESKWMAEAASEAWRKQIKDGEL